VKTATLLAVLLATTGCAHDKVAHRDAAEASPLPAIADRILLEAGWKPLPEAAADHRQVIRVASVFALIDRPYVQIVQSGTDVVLQLSDSIGNRVARPLAPEQWAHLVKMAEVLRLPMGEAKAAHHWRAIIKHYGECHGWNEIETALGGQLAYAYTSVCFGPAGEPRLGFVDEVNRMALATFPECGRATQSNEIVQHLAYCPTDLVKKGIRAN